MREDKENWITGTKTQLNIRSRFKYCIAQKSDYSPQ
jgi:hypothetical protein